MYNAAPLSRIGMLHAVAVPFMVAARENGQRRMNFQCLRLKKHTKRVPNITTVLELGTCAFEKRILCLRNRNGS